jgi:hypothetical protein
MESSTLLGGEGLVTDTEKAIGAIWSDLLHPERPIGRADNFFDVGGHSLLALEAIRQIETKLGTRLEMRTLIINKLSTIAELLDAREETEEAKNEPVALNAQMRRALSPDQKRLVSMHLDRGYPLTCFNLPALWELNGPFAREQFESAFERVLARQTALRTTVSTDKDDPLDLSGYYLRSIHQKDHDWLDVIDYRGEASEDSAFEKAVEEIFELSGAPFTLVDQPLIQARLYQISDSRYLFFFNAHQLIFDGWSFDILLRELETYYSSFSEAKAVDLDRLDLEYRDYCHWVGERQKQAVVCPGGGNCHGRTAQGLGGRRSGCGRGRATWPGGSSSFGGQRSSALVGKMGSRRGGRGRDRCRRGGSSTTRCKPGAGGTRCHDHASQAGGFTDADDPTRGRSSPNRSHRRSPRGASA